MLKWAAAAVVCLVLVPVGGVALLAGAASSVPAAEPSAAALSTIPAEYLALYRAAAATCPGLDWSVLAAIGAVESDHGRSTSPGVRSGSNWAGAEGPMQFEAATFAAYAVVAPGGAAPASPYDPADAVYSAARLLCDDGGGSPAGLRQALFAYNHSDAYVARVLALAASYQDSGAALTAVAFAQAALGSPYLWGGEGPGGFDCSGLVQAAYASAGISLPRTASAQWEATTRVPAGSPLQSGDLVFFEPGGSGAPAGEPGHVGIYVGGGQMIDAPNSASVVRVEPDSWPDYMGATRPGAGAGQGGGEAP